MNEWFQNEDEESDHRHMIDNQHRWPGGILCLKRPGAVLAGGTMDAYARVYPGAPYTAVTMDGQSLVYESAQAMLDDGWVVD